MITFLPPGLSVILKLFFISGLCCSLLLVAVSFRLTTFSLTRATISSALFISSAFFFISSAFLTLSASSIWVSAAPFVLAAVLAALFSFFSLDVDDLLPFLLVCPEFLIGLLTMAFSMTAFSITIVCLGGFLFEDNFFLFFVSSLPLQLEESDESEEEDDDPDDSSPDEDDDEDDSSSLSIFVISSVSFFPPVF